MSRYREMRYWSPILGCEAARLSMANSQGIEYFTIVAVDSPKAYRETREKALDKIEAAIAEGREPGEVA